MSCRASTVVSPTTKECGLSGSSWEEVPPPAFLKALFRLANSRNRSRCRFISGEKQSDTMGDFMAPLSLTFIIHMMGGTEKSRCSKGKNRVSFGAAPEAAVT